MRLSCQLPKSPTLNFAKNAKFRMGHPGDTKGENIVG